jgi:hypothetical protein
LEQAAEDAVAIGHFNISNLVLLKAVFAAARDLNVSVIVGASQERNFMFSLKKRRTAHDLLQERSGGFVAVFSLAVLLFVGIVIHLWVSALRNKAVGPSRGTPFLSLGPAPCRSSWQYLWPVFFGSSGVLKLRGF